MSGEGKRSRASPPLLLACTPVRRKNAQEPYSPEDYEVYLSPTSEGSLACPCWPAGSRSEPAIHLLTKIRFELGLIATQAYPLKVFGQPQEKGGKDHSITTFYAVPVSLDCDGESSDKFYCLDYLISNMVMLEEKQKKMIRSLDQWLRERHTISFVNLDLIFLCSKEGEGVGGLMKAVIENPLHAAQVKPPEDKLVIALNNPLFSSNGFINGR